MSEWPGERICGKATNAWRHDSGLEFSMVYGVAKQSGGASGCVELNPVAGTEFTGK